MGKVEKHKAVTLFGAEMERFCLPERVSNITVFFNFNLATLASLML